MNKHTQPVPVTGAEHPLRRVRLRRGLTQVELASGGLARRAAAIVRRFADVHVVVCGRNAALKRRLDRLAARSGGRLTVTGFVHDMADWMRCSDLVVTKAGPGTIAEATCCGTPLLLTSHLPGQEKGNTEFVAGAGAGRRVPGVRRLVKLRRDLAALNAGNYQPLLASFDDDAVLVFADGKHRWAGQHRGCASIEAFLRDFVAAGLRGDVRDLLIGGPPWRMRTAVRFDDHAEDPSGTRLYDNRTVLYVTARWGKIVRQEDFFADTSRIEAFEQRLSLADGRHLGDQ